MADWFITNPSRAKNQTFAVAAFVMVVGGGLLLAYWLKATISPYAILFLSLSVGCLLIFQHARGAKPFVYNAAFLLLALSLGELYLDFEKTNNRNAYPHLQSGGALGYSAKPGVFRAVKTYAFGRGVVYDVKYTIESSGVRYTPSNAIGPTAYFFGDSFTFGEGVNDDEALPFAFSAVSGMKAVNFGLGGYGPHHMLRMLERDLPGTKGFPLPKLVVYLALATDTFAHIERAAGNSSWDQGGPHYEVRNGRAQFVGPFPNKARMSSSYLDKLLNLSRIYQAWHPAPLNLRGSNDPKTHERDRNRFLAIVLASKAIVTARYRSPFVFILWDLGSSKKKQEDADWIESRLRRESIPVLRVSRLIKARELEAWVISRDRHPDARAYRYVAQELLRFLEQTGVGVAVYEGRH